MTIKINLPENPDDFFWLTGYSPDGAIECLPYHYGLVSVRSYASEWWCQDLHEISVPDSVTDSQLISKWVEETGVSLYLCPKSAELLPENLILIS